MRTGLSLPNHQKAEPQNEIKTIEKGACIQNIPEKKFQALLVCFIATSLICFVFCLQKRDKEENKTKVFYDWEKENKGGMPNVERRRQ